MESQISAVMARIQEIQDRLGMLSPEPVSVSAPSSTRSVLPNSKSILPNSPAPFPVALEQAGIHLRPLSDGPRFAPYIEGLIDKYAGQSGLSPNLVRAVIQQESGGNPRDVSKAGAQGLMQLMPEEAQEFGVSDPFDPEQNIAAGTRLLSGLMRDFKGDLPLALAAYNAGAPTVRKYNGVPPYPETQNYVSNIMKMLGQPSR